MLATLAVETVLVTARVACRAAVCFLLVWCWFCFARVVQHAVQRPVFLVPTQNPSTPVRGSVSPASLAQDTGQKLVALPRVGPELLPQLSATVPCCVPPWDLPPATPGQGPHLTVVIHGPWHMLASSLHGLDCLSCWFVILMYLCPTPLSIVSNYPAPKTGAWKSNCRAQTCSEAKNSSVPASHSARALRSAALPAAREPGPALGMAGDARAVTGQPGSGGGENVPELGQWELSALGLWSEPQPHTLKPHAGRLCWALACNRSGCQEAPGRQGGAVAQLPRGRCLKLAAGRGVEDCVGFTCSHL
ncbi:uncharacterized protein LOC134477947 [Cavia porcellus]|uniref:uncharacterized protein LOC134477947 n=1 Tax=Cavia porcellus TaxID=10141 RepID=UPI002FE13446